MMQDAAPRQPVTDYRVQLDAYNGPLDLLLFLVRRHEVDLNDIPVAALTDQYLAYLKQMERIDMDLAGEFLVMAATLLEIKSQMLLPREQQGEGDPTAALDELDPRYELVQQLLAYKRFKDAALDLEDRMVDWEKRFAHVPAKVRDRGKPAGDEDDAEEMDFDLEDANVMDLCEAFARILESIGKGPAGHEVVYDDTPIGLHAEDILDRLQRQSADAPLRLSDFFAGRRSRGELIGLFLAMLELVNQKRIQVLQDRLKGDIHLALRPPEEQAEVGADKATDWRDPQTGEMQYDWPSEQIRLRAERRGRLRLSRFAKGRTEAGAASAEPAEHGIVDDDEEAFGEEAIRMSQVTENKEVNDGSTGNSDEPGANNPDESVSEAREPM